MTALLDRAARYALVTYALLLPFGTFSFGRAAFFDASVVNLLTLLTVPLLVLYGTVSMRPVVRIPETLLIFGLIASAAISSIVTNDYALLTSLLAYLIIFVFATLTLQSPGDLTVTLLAFVLGTIVLNVVAVLEGTRIIDVVGQKGFSAVGAWSPSFDRTTGVVGLDFGTFASYNIFAFTALVFRAIRTRGLGRVTTLLGIVILLAGGLFAQTRSLWLLYAPATALGLILYQFGYRPTGSSDARAIYAAGALLGGGFLVALLAAPLFELFWFLVEMRSSGLSTRLANFERAFDFITRDMATFLWGGGIWGFADFSGSGLFDNHFGSFLVTGGVLAFLFYIALWGLAGWRLFAALRVSTRATPQMEALLILGGGLVMVTILINMWARVTNQKFLWLLLAGACSAPLLLSRLNAQGDTSSV